jgi:biotin carboxyl carrier protein
MNSGARALRSLGKDVPNEPVGESAGLGVRLVVAPSAGRLRHLTPVRFHDGHEWVNAGQPLAVIEQGSTEVEVVAPIEARVAGVLVRDGEPVVPGQPLVWLDEAPRRTTSDGDAGGPR